MRVTLFDFQQDALESLYTRLAQARAFAASDNPQAISFSAPTGSGKTIVMTALFESIFFGEPELEAQPDAVILWISDMPELNTQTRLKIESKSDRIRVNQLVTINSSYDAERLEGGRIYFINTQKLGTDKLLTLKGDSRQYTLWETLTKTALAIPKRFYVVIDEAHRGMQRSEGDAKKAQTILQKFLLGSEEDGLCPMPLVLGITATPSRFESLLAGTPHTVHKVTVSVDDVRASGLLKDRILIHCPAEGTQPEMTLLAEAARRWQAMTERWSQYCQAEGMDAVRPILVIQVEDAAAGMPTKTDLSTALDTLQAAIGRPLGAREVAHALQDRGELKVGQRTIRHLDASRIQDDPAVNVVVFKMSLSTGWDCPRAEVMMSFRTAQDHTYIAQLLGRMVRTPLARRIERDAALNDVHLFLPHYDEDTVKAVIEDLKNVEDVPPSETGISRELVILQRRAGTESIFEAMQKLETYRVNAVRKQSALRRLMGLGRGLTHDQIAPTAQEDVTAVIVGRMADQVRTMREAPDFEELTRQISGVEIVTTIWTGSASSSGDTGPRFVVDAALSDIDGQFAQAGRRLSNGLHMAYWKAQDDRDSIEVKVETIVFARDEEQMSALITYAEEEFNRLYAQHKPALAHLNETRRQRYDALRLSSAEPAPIAWVLPDSIPFRCTAEAPRLERHLYVDEHGVFRTSLGPCEEGVLEEELADPSAVAWLRNVDRQRWSLEIPYHVGGSAKPMFPDLIIIRQGDSGMLFDILEPHDPSRADNVNKAIGLAQFADKHWHQFDRVQLIRKNKGPDGKEHFYRLDFADPGTRKAALMLTNNEQLDQLFKDRAKLRSA